MLSADQVGCLRCMVQAEFDAREVVRAELDRQEAELQERAKEMDEAQQQQATTTQC